MELNKFMRGVVAIDRDHANAIYGVLLEAASADGLAGDCRDRARELEKALGEILFMNLDDFSFDELYRISLALADPPAS